MEAESKCPKCGGTMKAVINPVALTDVPKESPMQLRCEKCGHQQDALIGRRH
jgi:predicted nucleic acid-binding Zn ribbon protein